MKISLPITAMLMLSVLAGAYGGQQPHRKVLVLGAGVAGVTAANYLQQGGVSDFLVMEGQDYVGGRVKLVPFGGYKVEAGANWIHLATDEESKVLWKYHVENNQTGIWCNYSDFIIRNESGADVLNMKDIHKLIEVEEKIEAAQALRKKNKLKDIPARVGVTLLGWKPPRSPARRVLEYFVADFEYGKRLEQVSFNNMFNRGSVKDFFVTDQRGFFNMFNKTVEKFEDKIKLGQTVKKIEYNTTAVKVTTSAGDVYTADYAICTFSTGVLASDMVTFDPPLPAWKTEAILKSPMSDYTKIFVKFAEKFWDDNEYILLANKRKGYYPVIQDLERPGILPVNSSILLVTVTEDEARRVELQSDEQTKQEIWDVLKKVYGNRATQPTDIYYHRWSQNPYIRGSYSEGVVGVDSKTFENLAKNLGPLYFAGEALDEDWYSYLQGAELSGRRTGQMIAKMIKCKAAGRTDCEPTKAHSSVRVMTPGSPFSVLVLLAIILYFFVSVI